MPRSLPLLVLLAALPGTLAAQGTIARSPNISGDWVVRPGVVQFNFLHRFVSSPAPVHKVSNFPTFLLATSFYKGTTLGFNYATNSTLAPAFPNEWEFFVRAQPLTQAKGFPLDVGGQAGWNVAADGLDGELSLARQVGRLRAIAVGRALSDPYSTDGGAVFPFGGAAALKLTRPLALSGHDPVRHRPHARQLNAGKKGKEAEDAAAAFKADDDGFVQVVFVLEGETVVARQVETGIQGEDLIEIASGLEKGTTVISGSYRAISRDLKPGAKVKVNNEPEKQEQT